ncbi:diguanylate cyclase [Engelhardtia mirabilis]|uniref:diguanylate cyclase n=1 Tax=Engelhardtia mirabilis TaxID=2528011 RepID=A0A518BRI3_9BACT|nr:Response regulator PleD [Planctomycetes bacterium Pla133]QDV03910.1 Response regulator PleD [Planctomycetes bacterium Pla86]
MFRKEFEELKATGQLPSPSGVGMRILTLTQEEDCSIDELIETMQADPALTGRIVKLATSAQVSTSRPISSLNEAAMRLGLKTVSTVALGFTLVTGNRSGACTRFDYDGYWSESLACGIAASKLSRELGRADPAEAFTCGLMAAIGELALACTHPEDYAEIIDRLASDPGLDRKLLETEAFRINHCEVAASLMADWGLPERFQDVVMYLEDETGEDSLDESSMQLFQVLVDGAIIAKYCMAGRQADPVLLEQLNLLRRRLDAGDIDLAELCDEVVADWVEWGAVLELPTEDMAERVRSANLEQQLSGNKVIEVVEAAELPVRVLAVDDDPLSLRVLARHLKEAGHEVHTARNGREALAMTLKLRPQIIVTDLNMPDLNGLEFCKALRRSRFGKRIYVLLLTGDGNEERVLEGFEAGVDDFITKPFIPRVLLARLRAGIRLVRLQEQVERDQEIHMKNAMQMTRLNRQLKEAANTDFLTKLPNRRCAMAHFERTWKHAMDTDTPISVVALDIDHFKRVNDDYGHDVGDVVLQETSRVLRQSLRRQDLAARMGGEEFLVICPGVAVDVASHIAERVRSAVEENVVEFGKFKRNVTVSVGVAQYEPGIVDIDHLMRLADESVYSSKSGGRNRVTISPGLTPKLRSA